MPNVLKIGGGRRKKSRKAKKKSYLKVKSFLLIINIRYGGLKCDNG
jgi:hypothetical protein